MRDYGKVSPQFWIGNTGKQLKAKGIETQLVALYLITCSHANMIGLYYLPKLYIAHECGLTLEGASKGLTRACESGFCSYDDASEMVWVHEMAIHQIAEQLKAEDKRVKGIQNEYNAQPNNPYLKPFFDKYKDKFLMNECREYKAPSKPLASQEQEQDQEQLQEHETGASLPRADKTAPPTALMVSDENSGESTKETELQKACKATWKAYSDAYFDRYGVEPVRNAKVNANVKQLVQRLGYVESPHVAAFFVGSNNSYYISRAHSVDCIVKDAEKLRTEWATGNRVTQSKAKQLDNSQNNLDSVGEALRILEAGNGTTG